MKNKVLLATLLACSFVSCAEETAEVTEVVEQTVSEKNWAVVSENLGEISEALQNMVAQGTKEQLEAYVAELNLEEDQAKAVLAALLILNAEAQATEA